MDKNFSSKVVLNLLALGYVLAEWAPGWLAKFSGWFMANPLSFSTPWTGAWCAGAMVLLVVYCSVLDKMVGVGLGAGKDLAKLASKAGADLASAGADAAKVAADAGKKAFDSVVDSVEAP